MSGDFNDQVDVKSQKSLKGFPLQVTYYEETLLSNPTIDFTFFLLG